jgi:uncharacterized protein DUF3152/putative peptidoglycan binding protein
MKNRLKSLLKTLRSKRAVALYAAGAAVFLLINGAVALAYKGKTYPKTYVAGQRLGSLQTNQIEERLKSLTLLAEDISLSYKTKATAASPAELGLGINYAETVSKIERSRSWLPLLALVKSYDVAFVTDVDDVKLQKFLERYIKSHSQSPKDARIVLDGGVFSAKPEVDGHRPSAEAAKTAIVEIAAQGGESVTLEAETVPAKIRLSEVQSRIEVIKKQQSTSVTLRYSTKSKKFTPAEIATWYEVDGAKAELTDANIQAAVTSTGATFGILVKNFAEATAAIKSAVQATKPLDFTLVEAPKPRVSHSYCVAARGVSGTYLSGLASKLASVFADTRGWGLKGQVALHKTGSGCDFTVWLSSPAQMPTFGAICDPTWSCRVGANVVINLERWQNASPAWNASGGKLDDYRSMVINHEVGHWFGYGHASCGCAGQLAPVMQQQSINLAGCKFNPWPTSSELAAHRRSLGL